MSPTCLGLHAPRSLPFLKARPPFLARCALPIQHTANGKLRMTMALFASWLEAFNANMRNADRPVFLF